MNFEHMNFEPIHGLSSPLTTTRRPIRCILRISRCRIWSPKMSFAAEATVPGLALKKFVTEDEVEEKKRKRQEEWEKVRKPEEPLEFPEAPEDMRCLYDKLEEQRLRKDEEHDEKYKFKNQIAKLDEDESKFLEFVSDRQQEMVKSRTKEEAIVLSEMKDAQVVKVTDSKPDDKKPRASSSGQQTNKKSQMALLAGAVKRKGSDENNSSKRPRSEDTDGTSASDSSEVVSHPSPAARIIGVLPSVLPGLAHYEPSSDSESSSSDSEPDFSLASRSNVALAMRQVKQAMHGHHN